MKRGTFLAVATTLATALQAMVLAQLSWRIYGPEMGAEAAALRAWAAAALPNALCDSAPARPWPLPATPDLSRVHSVALQCGDANRLLAVRAPYSPEAGTGMGIPLHVEQGIVFGSSELRYLSSLEGNLSLLSFAVTAGLGLLASSLALVLLHRERQVRQLVATAEARACRMAGSGHQPDLNEGAARGFVEACKRSLGQIESLFTREAARQTLIRLKVRRLFDQLALGLVIYDAQGRIRGINRHARKLLGIAQLGRRPQHMESLVADDESGTLKRLLDQLNRTGSHSMADREFRRQLRTVSGDRKSVV